MSVIYIDSYRFGVSGPTDPYFSNVSLLLHGDGTNGSTTIIDSSPSPKTVTAFGNAQISTTQSKFGGGSLYFDGTAGTYASATDNDFAFGANNFTFEFWVYFPSGFAFATGMAPIYIGNNNNTTFSPFSIRDASGTVVSYINGVTSPAWNIAANVAFTTIARDQWLHWCIARDGSNWYTFENGQIKSQWVNSDAVYNPLGGNVLTLARAATDSIQYVECFIDDLRITKGVARYTSNFTPPTAPFPNS